MWYWLLAECTKGSDGHLRVWLYTGAIGGHSGVDLDCVRGHHTGDGVPDMVRPLHTPRNYDLGRCTGLFRIAKAVRTLFCRQFWDLDHTCHECGNLVHLVECGIWKRKRKVQTMTEVVITLLA